MEVRRGQITEEGEDFGTADEQKLDTGAHDQQVSSLKQIELRLFYNRTPLFSRSRAAPL